MAVIIGKHGNNCHNVIKLIMENFSAPESRDEIVEFVNFDTLNERLKNRNTITMEFMNAVHKWRSARFIVVERLADGRISRAMYLTEDIDEEVKERTRLMNNAERALAASQAKSSFLSNMSHEIRTPINAVLGLNEMILRESEDKNVLSYAESVRTAGTTLLGLVNDILDFSKLEAGKMEIIPVDYDISSLLNDLVNMIRIKADNKGLMLKLAFDKDTPKLLRGDEIRIKQVITNILTNAVKYTERGSVTFGVTYSKIADEPESVWH